MSLEDTRREYRYGKLDRNSLLDSPFEQFDAWMTQAMEAGIQDPTAMTVSTVSAAGRPWTRIVLLKGFDETGFYFYTSMASRKGRDIAANAHVCLHFPWLAMDRQVIVGGTASALSTARTEAYFATRPRESQLAAWVATQSTPVSSREYLDSQFREVEQRFADKEIPKPDGWGGYQIVPASWEFWQGGEFRLHDRFSYEQAEDDWTITRLAP